MIKKNTKIQQSWKQSWVKKSSRTLANPKVVLKGQYPEEGSQTRPKWTSLYDSSLYCISFHSLHAKKRDSLHYCVLGGCINRSKQTMNFDKTFPFSVCSWGPTVWLRIAMDSQQQCHSTFAPICNLEFIYTCSYLLSLLSSNLSINFTVQFISN